MIMNKIRTFKYRGLVIDEVESDGSCRGCFFYTPGGTRCSDTLECVSLFREDGKDVIYKKQNKMGKVTIEDLKNTKIYLSSKEDRAKFQEKVFKLGVKWSEGDQSVVDNTNGDMFFTIDNYLHLFLDWGKTYFINNTSKQIFLDEVLSIKEPKIDFKPFDKVLVRDSDNERWKPKLFAWHNVDYGDYQCPFEATDGCFYRYCIPYDESLANTTKSPVL